MSAKPPGCRVLGLLLGLIASGWPGLASATSPEITVTEESVAVSLTPSSRAAAVGLMRRSHGKIPGFERWEGILVDDDGDGRVFIALERPANPETSVWIVVDLASGEWATSGRFEPAEPAGLLATGGELLSGSALWPVPVGIVEVLVVRPGAGEAGGAWAGSVWDGGPADGDGVADGSAGVVPAALRPIGASGPAPETFAAGDVLIAVTPRGLRYGITRVVEGAEEVSR